MTNQIIVDVKTKIWNLSKETDGTITYYHIIIRKKQLGLVHEGSGWACVIDNLVIELKVVNNNISYSGFYITSNQTIAYTSLNVHSREN